MLEDLRALVEFAHAGSIAGAADRLFRTPSAITRQLQRLEAELGAELLDRSTSRRAHPKSKCVLHEIGLRAPPQALTTRSISTQAPSGSAATPIAVRAGKGALKYFA